MRPFYVSCNSTGFQYIERGFLVLLVEETPEICAKIQIIFEYMQAYWFNFVTPKGFLYTDINMYHKRSGMSGVVNPTKFYELH